VKNQRPIKWAVLVIVSAACGSVANPSGGTTSSNSTTMEEPSSSTIDATTQVDASTSLGESSSVGTSSADTSSTSAETGAVDCTAFATEAACEAAGCRVEHGDAFAWDDATGVCTSLGPTFVCHDSEGVLTAPGYYWRAVDDEVEVVLLNSMPFDLQGWQRCDCRPGDPLACFGCGAGPECTAQACDAIDAEACAALDPAEHCAWVEVTTFAADGTGCMTTATQGRCIIALPDKASCELVDMPRTCAQWTDASPPYVRSVDGEMELLGGTSCDAWPMGYMPCWSAPVDDPAVCDCACS